jgi:hypothetical protein
MFLAHQFSFRFPFDLERRDFSCALRGLPLILVCIALLSATAQGQAQTALTPIEIITSDGTPPLAREGVKSGEDEFKVAGENMTTPENTFFLEFDDTFTHLGDWRYQGFSITGGNVSFVLRFATDSTADGSIIPADQLSSFTNNQTYNGWGFDNQFGTRYVTLGPGQYYLAARNQVSGSNKIRIELDNQITEVPGFRYYDQYMLEARTVSANGGLLWQGFSIQQNIRYFVDGANSGVESYIIPASEITKFRNRQAFTYYVDYSDTGGGTNAPGNFEITLPPGEYYLCFRNQTTLSKAVTYVTERWVDTRFNWGPPPPPPPPNATPTPTPTPVPTPTPTPTPAGSSTVQFTLTSDSVSEGAGFKTVTATRSGNTQLAASVNYATSDTAGLAACNVVSGKASERCDYGTSLGTLRWAAGEGSTKTFSIPVVDDRHPEGNETFTVSLSGPVSTNIGANSLLTINITDNGNDSSTATNPIDDASFYINEQYIDFLSRLPDGTGFQNWMATLGSCPGGGYGTQNPDCDRIKIAMSTFQSVEFQSRGYWAYRFYEVAFGRRPNYAEFIPDMAQVGGQKSPAEEVLSKDQFMNDFSLRSEFTNKYNSTAGNPTAYVDLLLQTAGLPSHFMRGTWISNLQTGQKTRPQVLREIVESKEVEDKFYVRGFVSMMYYGFLRRDPDPTGFQNYVNKLNATWDPRGVTFDFIYSAEYLGRFGKP